MGIKSLAPGRLEFDVEDKVLGQGSYGEAPITERFWGEIPLTFEFADGSSLVFRYGLNGQRFTNHQNYFLGAEGAKEVFLQPCHYDLREGFVREGFLLRESSNAQEDSDWYDRLSRSFIGLSLERLALEQDSVKGIDTVILANRNGELRFVFDYSFLIAIEDRAYPDALPTIYEVREKGSHYREPNLMIAAALAQQPRANVLDLVGKALTENPDLHLEQITEADLFFEVKAEGKIVHLGPRIA